MRGLRWQEKFVGRYEERKPQIALEGRRVRGVRECRGTMLSGDREERTGSVNKDRTRGS